MTDALLKIATAEGQNCLVVTHQPYVTFFVDPFKNLGLTSSKKSYLVANAKDVVVGGTLAKVQLNVTAAKDGKRSLDDLNKWTDLGAGVQAMMQPNQYLAIRFNLSAVSATARPLVSVNQKAIGENSGLVLNATIVNDGAGAFPLANMDSVTVKTSTSTTSVTTTQPVTTTVSSTTTAIKPATKAAELEPSQARFEKTVSGVQEINDIFALDASNDPYVTIIATLPAGAEGDEEAQYTLAQCAPPNIGCYVTVRWVDALLQETQFRPVADAMNVEVMEVASKRQVIVRFDRTKEVAADPDERVRTVATTAGSVVTGGAEISVVCVYEFSDPTAEEYYDAVYKILAPQNRRGLQTLSMREVHSRVFAELNIYHPTHQSRQRVRDATREYIVYGQQAKRPLHTEGELYRSHMF